MSNIVEYILNLKDNLSPALTAATSHAQHLESSLSSVKSMAAGIGTALGIAFGAYQIVNFAKEGYEAFHLLEQETAKVEANLDATSGKAGMAISDISGFAKELSSKIQASRVDIMDMSSQLLTFPAITKDVFQSSMGLVADIAKQTNHGLSETAIMYGKALSNPAEGLQKMQRYGVMLTDQEKEKIKQLQASGNLIGAQKQMMDDIAHSGYAGVAERMFNANPVSRFNKMMDGAKLEVGEMMAAVLKKLMPALETLGRWFKGSIEWMKEHQKTMSLVGYVMGALATVILVVASATGVWTAAQWALNLAMSANPVVLTIIAVIAALAIVVASIMWAWNTFEGFRKFVFTVWEVLKAFGIAVGRIFYGIGEVIAGVWEGSPAKIAKGIKDQIDAVKNGIKDIQNAAKTGSDEGAKSYRREKGTKTLIPDKPGGTGKPGGDGTNAPTPKTKAEGQKTINIHVAYNAPLMSGGITISTTNLHEGAGKIKEILTEMLVGATHDTLMVADY